MVTGATPASRSSSVRRIGELASAGAVASGAFDARTFRQAALAEITRVVAVDAYAWVLTDPETTVGTAPLADVSAVADLSVLPELIRRKYLTAAHRWTSLDDVATMACLSPAERDAAPLWGWLHRRHGVVDVASLVFTDRFGVWGFLDLWRSRGRLAFHADDMAYLHAVVAPVSAALRRVQAATFVAGSTRPPRFAGPTVLLLSPDLEPIGQTPAADDQLRRLVPRDDGRPPVPADAFHVAAQLLASEAGIDDHEAMARTHLPDGGWLTMRAARLGPAADPTSDIAVTIEPASTADRLEVFARAVGLSPREHELLVLVAGGRDTRAVAEALFVSQHTVQDHLKSIFAKTGVRSRPALVSLALGT